MPSSVADRQVRISRIGGRYLVFDIDDVVHIRRDHGICAVLTGTMAQAPTQNIFLGLPIELYPEEVKLLVDKKVAYIADDVADHLSQLTSMDETTRRQYLGSLKSQRKTAQAAFEDTKAKKRAQYAHLWEGKAKSSLEEGSEAKAAGEEEADMLFSSEPAKLVRAVAKTPLPAITPTTSGPLISACTGAVSIGVPPTYPLYAYLNSKGYYITPGLRFGGDYSVYPGDPFRFHAHYLANSYGWNEEIPMLDLVTSGRLGTAVKKSFLFGAEQPAQDDPTESDSVPGSNVRVFCVEWAGM